MAAQAELDRYIKENEASLYNINQSKLRRNPLSESKLRQEQSFSVASISYDKMSHAASSAPAQELERFIVRLKQMQQFRVSQLQKVNALFIYDMDLEDQMDLNMKTAEEVEQMCENENFEAFLLGLTKEDVQEKEKENSEAVPAEVMHSTMFTKRKPPPADPAASDSSLPYPAEDNTTAATTVSHNDLLAHVDDASVIQLQKSRLERNARLKSITATIHAMGLLTAPPSVSPTLARAQPSAATKYSGSALGQFGAAMATPEAGTGVPSWRQLPPRTSQRGAITAPLTTRPPPVVESRSINQSSYSYAASSSSSIESKEDELHPPPPPVLTDGSVFPVPPAAQLVYSPAPPPPPPEAQAAMSALTLQAIADDDLYLSSSTAVVSIGSELRADVPVYQLAGTPVLFTADAHSAGHDALPAAASTRAAKRVPKPFLVNNARRRDAERAVHSEGSADEDRQSHRDPDLSLSTIAARSYASESGGSGSELSEVERDGFSDHSDAKGIGYGRRYGAASSTHRHASQSKSGPMKGKELRWDGVDGGGDDGSVESASRISTRQRSGRPDTSDRREGHEGIFDYMDALESPDPKRSARVRSRDSGAPASGATQERSRGAQSRTDAMFEEAETAASASQQLCDRAAQITASASRYYQRRLYRLEHGSDPEDDDVQGERKIDSQRGGFSAASPERRGFSRTSGAYDSPTPKTPTFNPLFS